MIVLHHIPIDAGAFDCMDQAPQRSETAPIARCSRMTWAAVKNCLVQSIPVRESDSMVWPQREGDVASERAGSKLTLDMRINATSVLPDA